MTRSVSVAIVGAGFGGVAAAIELKRQGFEDVVLLERSDRCGGVWCANTYPGLACDVPSHLYSFSFEPNPDWSRRYSPGLEIQAYLEDVARRHDVLRHVRFGADVQKASFDEEASRWKVEIAGGDEVEAEVLVTACGQLSRAQVPEVEGLDRFAGPMFHSAHWDHDVDLRGKRVAVLGTGASAIQFVPAIAKQVEHLTVFQRSAPWVLPKMDRAYPERTKRLHKRVPALPRLWRRGWWAYMESAVPLFTRQPAVLAKVVAKLGPAGANAYRRMKLRGETELLQATEPNTAMGCKRVLVTSEWYPTLRRPNVDLVTNGVKEVTEDAVVGFDGTRHPADVIVFGTGYASTEFLTPMEVEGRGGRSLSSVWARGAEAYYGLAVPEFPNLFLLYGPNTNHGVGSVIHLHEAQARYVTQAVQALASGRAERLEVRREAHETFQGEMDDRLPGTTWATCANWYRNADGRITNNWPGTNTEYAKRITALALDDYVTEVLRPASARAG